VQLAPHVAAHVVDPVQDTVHWSPHVTPHPGPLMHSKVHPSPHVASQLLPKLLHVGMHIPAEPQSRRALPPQASPMQEQEVAVHGTFVPLSLLHATTTTRTAKMAPKVLLRRDIFRC
jgi:hypothetical protein